jgi:NADPH-dependent FMN reductase
MKALVVNCTLKKNPQRSNTGALADVVATALQGHGVEVAEVRAVDHALPPGVEADLGEGDEWPSIREQILDAEILLFASPTWLGRPSSVAQRVLERMDAMLSEQDDEGPTTSSPRSQAPCSTSVSPSPARPGPTGTAGQDQARTISTSRRGTSGRTQPVALRPQTCSPLPQRLPSGRSRCHLNKANGY